VVDGEDSVAITTNRTGGWTTQAAQNLLMNLDEDRFRFVIHDGGGRYTIVG